MIDFLAGLATFAALMAILYSIGLPAWDEEAASRQAAAEKRVAQMSQWERDAIQQK